MQSVLNRSEYLLKLVMGAGILRIGGMLKLLGGE